MRKIIFAIIALVICASMLFSCNNSLSDKDGELETVGYEEALELIEDGKYEEAYEALLKLKNNKEAKELLSKFKFCYDRTVTKVPGEDVSASMENVYDKNGNCIESTMYMSGEPYGTSKMEYNKYNDVIRMTEVALDGSVTTSIEYTYKYDKNGNVTQKNVKQSTEGTEFESVYQYVYDNNGLLLMEVSDLVKEEYTYDKNGYLIKMVRTEVETGNAYSTTEYLNDEDGRPIKETRYNESNNVVAAVEYEYDNRGNIVKEKRSYGEDESAAMTVEYEYIGEHIFYVEKPAVDKDDIA